VTCVHELFAEHASKQDVPGGTTTAFVAHCIQHQLVRSLQTNCVHVSLLYYLHSMVIQWPLGSASRSIFIIVSWRRMSAQMPPVYSAVANPHGTHSSRPRAPRMQPLYGEGESYGP